MHEIHVYEGVVLGKRGVREADVLVDVLTPLGLLRAVARSARAEGSKLRYALEPLSRARFSFVRGRREWRLVGAEAVSRELAAAPARQRAACARVARLLLRLVRGEEASPELFETVSKGFAALAQTECPGQNGLASPAPPEGVAQDEENRGPFGRDILSQIQSLEVVLVLRILSHLGYLPHVEALAPFVEGEFSIELSAQALRHRALLIRTINESLHATGL